MSRIRFLALVGRCLRAAGLYVLAGMIELGRANSPVSPADPDRPSRPASTSAGRNASSSTRDKAVPVRLTVWERRRWRALVRRLR